MWCGVVKMLMVRLEGANCGDGYFGRPNSHSSWPLFWISIRREYLVWYECAHAVAAKCAEMSQAKYLLWRRGADMMRYDETISEIWYNK